MKTKTMKPNFQQLQFRKGLEAAIAGPGADLQADELLAITCHFVGQLIALQDQRIYTSDMIMQLVRQNIEKGNQEAVAQFITAPYGHA